MSFGSKHDTIIWTATLSVFVKRCSDSLFSPTLPALPSGKPSLGERQGSCRGSLGCTSSRTWVSDLKQDSSLRMFNCPGHGGRWDLGYKTHGAYGCHNGTCPSNPIFPPTHGSGYQRGAASPYDPSNNVESREMFQKLPKRTPSQLEVEANSV